MNTIKDPLEVPTALIEAKQLKLIDSVVWAYIKQYPDTNVFPSQSDMASFFKVAKTTINKSLFRLEKYGALKGTNAILPNK